MMLEIAIGETEITLAQLLSQVELRINVAAIMKKSVVSLSNLNKLEQH